MRLKILRAVRVKHQPGDIVEVSQADALYLLTTHSAEPVVDEPEAAEAEPEAKPAAEPVLDEPEAAETEPEAKAAAKPVRKTTKK